MIGSYNLVVSKNELEENLFQLRDNLITNQEIIITLRTRFCEYSNNTSTSKTVEVLRNHALDIIKILDEFIDLYAIMINKVNQIYYRYEELCGNSSLDENELKKTISKIDYLITLCEESIYHFRRVDGINVVYVQYLIDELIQYRRLYERKLDNLREFNDYVNNIFSYEKERITALTKELRRKLEVFSAKKFVKYVIATIFGTNVGIDYKQINEILTLKQQEELLGITYDDFVKLQYDMFGFDAEIADIMWELKVKCYLKYIDEDTAEFHYLRIIGRLYYGVEKQKLIFDQATMSCNAIEELKELGISDERIAKLKYTIRIQTSINDDDLQTLSDDFNQTSYIQKLYYGKYILSMKQGVYDYSQMSNDDIVSLALDYPQFYDEFLSYIRKNTKEWEYKAEAAHQYVIEATNLVTTYADVVNIDDQVSWEGDILGIQIASHEYGDPSFNQNDYIADLDAENIKHFKNNNNFDSWEEARRVYMSKINSGEINRAIYFRENCEPKYKTEILDYVRSQVAPKEYDNDKLLEYAKQYYPEAYNFIMNIENGNGDIYEEYV